MVGNLLNFFPDTYTPNTQQVKLIKNIEQAFEDGYKFVVCAAPTGSGKSFVSKTLSNVSSSPTRDFVDIVTSYLAYKKNSLGAYSYEEECTKTPSFGAFALTITKSLQDQYKSLFSDVEILKGKSNYQCDVDPSVNVEIGPCIHSSKLKEDCWNKNRCPYYASRNKAITSPFTTLNYNMFFSLPKHIKHREYIICDEASELEDQIVKEFSLRLSFDFLKKSKIIIPPIPHSDYGKLCKWLSVVNLRISDKVEDLKETINTKTKVIDAFINEKKAELIALKILHNKITLILDTWSDSEYLLESDAKSVSFTPLKVNKLAHHLFRYGDKIILMSATIIDPHNFCKSLGIDKFKYIEADSTFDPVKAPIYVQTKTKLNYSNLKQNLPQIKKQIIEICKFHSNDKGIIHTHSNYITEYLRNNIFDSRFLFREPGINNEELIKRHSDTEDPTILASPSMSHGVDLKDDLARFQIIIKAPFLPTTNKRVKELMKVDSIWYTNKMLSSLIQSCGRGVRSHKDHCVTYILDGTIIDYVMRNKHKLPKYFLDRFV